MLEAAYEIPKIRWVQIRKIEKPKGMLIISYGLSFQVINKSTFGGS